MTNEMHVTYNNICEKLDKLREKYNPCKMEIINNRFYCARDNSDVELNGCCHPCKQLDKDMKEIAMPINKGKSCQGCTGWGITCKFWVCPEAIEQMEEPNKSEYINEVFLLNDEFIKSGIPPLFKAQFNDYVEWLRSDGICKVDTLIDTRTNDWFISNFGLRIYND